MNQYMEFYKLLGEFYNEEDITVDSPMSEHIYFRVGGPADILVTPVNEEQVVNTLKLCREYNVPYFILGNGSNILVKDGGISGVVIKFNKLNKITTEGNCVTAQSGALLKDVSKAALENNLRGFEFACGIPGSIGGAVFMNAGAYDGEMAHVIKYVVIEATVELESGEYASIKDKIDDLTNRRESKQPLEYPSAGSTFKRPEGYFAGKLIQDSGLKGFSIGGAAVSEKHSGFVINKGGATAKDVLDVIAHVQKTVKENFDVELHTEVRIIGRD